MEKCIKMATSQTFPLFPLSSDGIKEKKLLAQIQIDIEESGITLILTKAIMFLQEGRRRG